MTDMIEATFTLVQIRRVFSDEMLTRVVQTALGHRAKATPSVRLRVESACRKAFRINGFSDPSRAPNHLLVRPVLESLGFSGTIVGALLALWQEARHPLRAAAAEFSVARNMAAIESDGLRQGFPSYWTVEEMWETAKAFCAGAPNMPEDEAALMLCCVTGCAPLRPEDITEMPDEDLATEVEPETPTAAPEPATSIPLLDAKPELPVAEETPESAMVEPLPVITVSEPSPFPDMDAAQRALRQQLDAAEDQLREGDLDALAPWGDQFAHDVRRAQKTWVQALVTLNQRAADVEHLITRQVAAEDQAALLGSLRSIVEGCRKPAQLADAEAALNRARSDVDEYRQRRDLARDALQESLKVLDTELALLADWQLDSSQWMTRAAHPDAGAASVREMERSAGLNRELDREIQLAVQQARGTLTAEILDGCEELRRRSTDAADVEAAHQITTRLMNGVSDIDLRACCDELTALQERLKQQLDLPEIQPPAAGYLDDPDQTYLDVLLDALAQHGRQAEVYALLGIALHGGSWHPGTVVSGAVLNAFFKGLLEVNPGEQALSAAINILADGLLASLISVDEPAPRLGLSIFYVGALAIRPGCVAANDLWRFRTDAYASQAPLWTGLIERVMQGGQPNLRRGQDLPADELKRVTNWLDDDLKREAGRFVRSRGKGSLVLTNMEQQYFLPALESQWKTLRGSAPRQAEWTKARQWLEATEADQFYIDQCAEAGISSTDSPHFGQAFVERARHVLQQMRLYVGLREEIAGIQARHPVPLDDALAELAAIAPQIGEPLVALTRIALAELGEESPAQPGASETLSREQRFALDLRRALLRTPVYWRNLPVAASWLGRQSLRQSDAWLQLLRACIESLAHPIETAGLFDYYLDQRLPDIARSCAPVERPEVAQRADDLKRALRSELQQRQAELKKYKYGLEPEEEIWLEENRWALLLASLDRRLTQMRVEEQQQEQSRRTLMIELTGRALNLEGRLMTAAFLPPATLDELNGALDAVRLVGRRSLWHCVDAAQGVVQEITHMLDYQSANAEGAHRAYEDLRVLIEARPQRPALEGSQSDSIERLIQALNAGDYDLTGVSPSTYSEGQWDDRARLLTLWTRVKGLPSESERLNREQLGDLRGLAQLVAKTVRMYYSERRSSERATHYFLPRPVVHFESQFVQPKIAAHRTNVVLVFLTESQPTPRRLKELDAAIDEQRWLSDGFYIAVMVPGEAGVVHDWARRPLRRSLMRRTAASR